MKELRYFLDANIFLRPIIKDNPRKLKECEVLFEKIKEGKLKAVTSNLVLAEIAWVCKSICGLDRNTIAGVLQRILNFKHLEIADAFNPYLAIEIYRNYSLKFIDALIASDIQIQNKAMIIVSYDKDFDKLGVVRKEPKQLI